MYRAIAGALRVAGGITLCGLLMANLLSEAGSAQQPPALLGQPAGLAGAASAPTTTTVPTGPTTELELVVPTFEVPGDEAAARTTTSLPEPPPATAPTTTLPPTSSATFVLPPGPADDPATGLTHAQLVGAAALERLTYDWEAGLPGWSIRFLPGRDGLLGATWPEDQQIDLYVRDGHNVDDILHVLAHELAHAVDVTWFDEDDRATWRAARGFPADRAWFGGAGESDYATPSGDFAEAFAVSQAGPVRYRGVAAPTPNPEQLQLVAQLAAR